MKKIKITSYDEQRNQYNAEIEHQPVTFDPFVSGILNGDNHDREKIEALVGKELELDLFQTIGGTWLLADEQQFVSQIN